MIPPLAEPPDPTFLTDAGRLPMLDDAQLQVLRSYGTEQEVADPARATR